MPNPIDSAVDTKLANALTKLKSAGLLTEQQAAALKAFVQGGQLPTASAVSDPDRVRLALATIGGIALLGFKT